MGPLILPCWMKVVCLGAGSHVVICREFLATGSDSRSHADLSGRGKIRPPFWMELLEASFHPQMQASMALIAAGLAQPLCADPASSLAGPRVFYFFFPLPLHGLCLVPSQIQHGVGLGLCVVCGSETGQRGEAGGPTNLMRLWGACVCPCP